MPDFGRWTSSGGDPSLNEINRADRFFESLAAKEPVYSTDPAEAELAFLLSGWRDDVRDAPVTAPVTARDAVEALHGGMARNRGSRRSFAVVGSVAAAMLCIGGFGTAVYGAGPGDALYGVRTALFGQSQVTRDDRVELASAQLAQVQQLIDNGQWQEAQDKLVAVSTTVQDVGQVEQKQQLVEQWNALTFKVVEQDPAATLSPGEPLPVLPSSPLTWLPVPVVEATTTSASTATSETTVSSTTDSSVPSEILLTPPSDGSTSPSSTSSTPTSASSPSSSPGSSTPPTAAPPTAVPPPPTSAVTVPPSTTTTTTVSREPEAIQQTSTSVVPPVVRSTSTAVAPPPASSAPPALAPVEPTRPATSTPPAERPSVDSTTTTLPPS
ncbi:MAG TPA: anti-sigma-D factor RsdA [Mycobacterium sp.]|nr:anti-sigma-D factor RsdA [Mycobacterium sp.]